MVDLTLMLPMCSMFNQNPRRWRLTGEYKRIQSLYSVAIHSLLHFSNVYLYLKRTQRTAKTFVGQP
ncbi:hypothetical protein NQ317_015466 [Molorchus minor]|uniref:Uncharacterized protein n=1 Tax=Molorchus minor TaxID=1323400 RepID=A0ABQ9J0B2_9CUCU|nr:hypothetical protein NQ317_015466 [Molorchus minor]